MEADTQAHVAFFLTGKRSSEHLDAVDGLGLRPALFAGYRDLSRLRYDFPVVLGGSGSDFIQSLSGVFDTALASVARGADADRIRKHALRIEQEIRLLAANGAKGTLSSLWDDAVARVQKTADQTFADSQRRVRAAIKVDGELADCDATLPFRAFRHAWGTVQANKATAFGMKLRRLMLKLSDILRSDYERSEAGRSAKHLKATVGTVHSEMFDFDAMSRVLSKALPNDALPESRRKRVRDLLAVLGSQQFYAVPKDVEKLGVAVKPYSFVFENCDAVLDAFRERAPKAIALAKAIAIAELEIEGQYNPEKHDPVFAEFGANGLDSQDLAAFPDYLLCVNITKMAASEQPRLLDILSSGLPVKILMQTDDILEESALGGASLSLGAHCTQLANMAMGLSDVYVMQTASSALYQLRDAVLKGFSYQGTALYTVYTGASGIASGLSPYLTAAAASESRAFPTFVYDPSAGSTWASRFCLDANVQAECDWPVRNFTYEDADHQTVSEDLTFTLVDFIASDRRYARHFARVPRQKWSSSIGTVTETLASEAQGMPEKIPSVLMIDKDNTLQRALVDDKLMREARRCRGIWHSLQELGGINNSHAERLVTQERKAWEEKLAQQAEAHAAALAEATANATAAPAAAAAAAAAAAVAAATAAPGAAATPAAPAAAPEPQEPERSPDEAYIETPRCSTCNECITLNSKMFAYNSDQQAYIKDIKAGTYAQLVEAAESCQVSIIHPGKPKNPDEPGLDLLIARAEAFL